MGFSIRSMFWQVGAPHQSLTGSFNGWQVEPIRKEFCLTKNAQGDETLEYFIEVACNVLLGVDNQAAQHRDDLGKILALTAGEQGFASRRQVFQKFLDLLFFSNGFKIVYNQQARFFLDGQ